MAKKNRLTKLKLGFVSLVDDGANQHARVEIMKRRDDGAIEAVLKEAITFSEAKQLQEIRRKAQEAMNDLWDAFDALRTSIDSILTDDEEQDKQSKIDQSVTQFKTAITALVPQLAVAKGFGADASEVSEMAKTLQELEAAVAAAEEQLAKMKGDLEAAQKAKADADAVIKAKDEEIAKLKGTAQPTDEEVFKNLPEPVRKRIEAAEQEAAASRAAVQKMADEREETVAIEKARTYKIGDAAKLGPIMVRVKKGKATDDDLAEIERIMKQAGELAMQLADVKKGGSGLRGDGGADFDGDPEAILKAKAEEIQKASGGKLTFEAAYSQAMEQNPKAYDAFIAKRRKAA